MTILIYLCIFFLFQDGDDDYDNLSENTGFKLDNGNASQDLFSPETSHDIFSCTGNESLLDGTLLSGDRLVAQPNKVRKYFVLQCIQGVI